MNFALSNKAHMMPGYRIAHSFLYVYPERRFYQQSGADVKKSARLLLSDTPGLADAGHPGPSLVKI